MAGLFGLFGKKKNDDKAQAKPTETNGSNQAYFLDADQAKTFGNIDYMRTATTVRRTFPKTAGNGGTFERVQTVSTIEVAKAAALKAAMQQAGVDAAKVASNPAAIQPGSEAARQRSDSSLDMFRKMARDIRKKQA